MFRRKRFLLVVNPLLRTKWRLERNLTGSLSRLSAQVFLYSVLYNLAH